VPRATIKEKREVAERTLFVTFDLQGEQFEWEPGQYFWVELVDPPYNDDRDNRRHITIVTSPTEGAPGLCTRVRDSGFKRSLSELPVGSPVEVEEPKGDFVLPAETDRPYVFVAGGIGITVFRCMLRYIQDKGLQHRVTLVYSNRNRAGAAFLDEIEELERSNPNLTLVVTMTDDPDWQGERRHIDPAMIRDHLGEDLGSYGFFVAGPPDMAEDVGEKLKSAGVPEDQVRVGKFAGY
jgi:ferredoxin-NADP reductase